MVFNDRDYGINRKNAEAELGFRCQDPVLCHLAGEQHRTPTADFVTTVVGLRFCSYAPFDPYFARLKKAIVSLKDQENRMGSTLKVMRCITKEKALGGPKALGRDKKAQLPALN